MTEFRSLAPATRRLWQISALLAVVPVVGVLVGGAAVVGNAWGWIGVGLLVAVLVTVAIWMPIASYRRWSYALREHDLVLRHGVLSRTERLVPRTRIQHVDLVEGILDRLLGLARLRIFTAGTSDADVALPGLGRATAVTLRDEMLSWVRTRSPAAAAIAESGSEDQSGPPFDPSPSPGDDPAGIEGEVDVRSGPADDL